MKAKLIEPFTVFHNLTVLSLSHITESHHYFYNCKCICGRDCLIRKDRLLGKKQPKSCGCLPNLRKNCGKNFKKYNTYIFENDIVKIESEKGIIIIDDLDFDLVNQHYWGINRGYGITSINRKGVLLHRLLMGFPKYPLIIDHIDGNTLNNRRRNLRICTQLDNAKNCSIHKDNALKVKGVYLDKRSGKYSAEIHFNGKKTHIGLFDNIEDASNAYKEQSIKLHKEFSFYNRFVEAAESTKAQEIDKE